MRHSLIEDHLSYRHMLDEREPPLFLLIVSLTAVRVGLRSDLVQLGSNVHQRLLVAFTADGIDHQ